MLQQPVVFDNKLSLPTATLSLPVVLAVKAFEPIDVLLAPEVKESNAVFPKATLFVPVG